MDGRDQLVAVTVSDFCIGVICSLFRKGRFCGLSWAHIYKWYELLYEINLRKKHSDLIASRLFLCRLLIDVYQTCLVHVQLLSFIYTYTSLNKF